MPAASRPASIGSRLRITRSGGSLRMHNRIAVDAVTGSSPRTLRAAGMTAADGIGANRMIKKPMTAFQNPITIQGNVTANSASNVRSSDAEAAGRQRQRGERQRPGHGSCNQDDKQHAPAHMALPAATAAKACVDEFSHTATTSCLSTGRELWRWYHREPSQSPNPGIK